MEEAQDEMQDPGMQELRADSGFFTGVRTRVLVTCFTMVLYGLETHGTPNPMAKSNTSALPT